MFSWREENFLFRSQSQSSSLLLHPFLRFPMAGSDFTSLNIHVQEIFRIGNRFLSIKCNSTIKWKFCEKLSFSTSNALWFCSKLSTEIIKSFIFCNKYNFLKFSLKFPSVVLLFFLLKSSKSPCTLCKQIFECFTMVW